MWLRLSLLDQGKLGCVAYGALSDGNPTRLQRQHHKLIFNAVFISEAIAARTGKSELAIITRISQNDYISETSLLTSLEASLYQLAPDAPPLAVWDHSQRRQTNAARIIRGCAESYRAESDVPDDLPCLFSNQRNDKPA